MTEHFTSLSPAALREIIANLEQSLAIYAQHPHRLQASEEEGRKLIMALRARLLDRLENHPDKGQ